jgi:TolB-like protein
LTDEGRAGLHFSQGEDLVKRAIFTFVLVVLWLSPLHSQSRTAQGIDALVSAATDETVKILPAGGKKTLAVSYFTMEGEKAGISDYLINGITTGLANRAKDRVTVVSRQALDRILAEASFQMSDLADQKSQIRLGRQLGADIILTGFITPAAGAFKLNTQLIQVETGVVLGGFLLDFTLEKEFAQKMATGSEVIRTEKRSVEKGGTASVTTVLEDFSGGRSDIQLSHGESYSGPEILSASGKITIDGTGGPDGSPCGRFFYSARLASENVISWRDSYLIFTASAKEGLIPAGSDGVSFSIKPVGFSFVRVSLRQQRGDEMTELAVEMVLNEGEWQDVKLPFRLFAPAEPGKFLDARLPVTLFIEDPFEWNWRMYAPRSSASPSAEIFLDDIGFYRLAGAEEKGLLGSFDDEITRIAFVPELADAIAYMDYARSDQGEEKRTPGVKSLGMSLKKADGGPSGQYLGISVHLDLDRSLLGFLKEERTFTFVVKAHMGGSWQGYTGLSFFTRSNLLSTGSLEYDDPEHDAYYTGASVAVSGIWSRIRVSFAELASDGKSLAETKIWTRNPSLTLYFDLPAAALQEAALKGNLDFSLDIDQIILE